MDTKEHRELLRLLRQVVTWLEQVSIGTGVGSVCRICGSNLRCVHCMGSEGGRKQNEMYDKQTKRKWGKKGGRPSKKKLTVDSITGGSVPESVSSMS